MKPLFNSHVFGLDADARSELKSTSCSAESEVCRGQSPCHWAVEAVRRWNNLGDSIFICMRAFYHFYDVHVSAAGVGAAACFLAQRATTHVKPITVHVYYGGRPFQSKHTAGTAAYGTLTEMSSLSAAPLASNDRPSFTTWSSLTVARLLIGESCRMGNYCSLG